MKKYNPKKILKSYAKDVVLDRIFSFGDHDKSLVHFTKTDTYIALSPDSGDSSYYHVNCGLESISGTSCAITCVYGKLDNIKITLKLSANTDDANAVPDNIIEIEKKSYEDELVEISFNGTVIYSGNYPYPIPIEKYKKISKKHSKTSLK